MLGDRKIVSMKPIRVSVCGAKCLAAILGSSLLTISVSAAPALKAFPTAEGFGANAVGGRGGRVIKGIFALLTRSKNAESDNWLHFQLQFELDLPAGGIGTWLLCIR